MSRKRPDPDGYGSRRLPVWRAGLRDRLRRNHARANARQGYLRQPHDSGKIIWLKAGGSMQSVRLGVELMGAIRQKRLDVRLVLTFENDYPEIIEPRVSGMRKIGLGYGPCDRPRVVNRVLKRLDPFAIILVDTEFPERLAELARAQGRHLLAFHTEPGSVAVEAAYPRDAAQEARWQTAGQGAYVAPAADTRCQFVEAHADTTLKSLAAQGERHLWWWHGPAAQAAFIAAVWRASELAQDGLLFISLHGDDGEAAVADLRISAWDRTALPAGRVVWVDDARWLGALASAATAVHLQQAAGEVLWQALAGGSALDTTAPVAEGVVLPESVPVTDDSVEALISRWAVYHDSPILARQIGDACRRRFWDERRRVESVSREFLQRVFDW